MLRLKISKKKLKFSHNAEYVKWNSNNKNMFDLWWWQIFVEQNIKNEFAIKCKNSLWYKKFLQNKQFDWWNHFNQLIFTIKKTFKIICKKCDKILNHSTTKNDLNISNMKKHFQINDCKTRKKFNFSSQQKLILTRMNNFCYAFR